MSRFRILWITIFTLLRFSPQPAFTEGLLYQLPDDGSWVRFELEGKGIGPDGQVKVTVNGTVTLSSVGQAEVEGEKCRWIEINSIAKRDGKEFSNVMKLLVPETRLKKGENPLQHVRQAWHKDSQQNGGNAQQLDLKSAGAGVVQSLDEVLGGPAAEVKELAAEAIESKLGKQECAGAKGRVVTKAGDEETEFTYEVRLHKDAPFGVVSYRYEKARKRGGQPLGSRTSTLKLVDYGKDAKSAFVAE